MNAEYQNVVYSHYLPQILSPAIMDKFGLRTNTDSTYFPEANPTLRNEFSTAANRFGHSQVQVIKGSMHINGFFSICQRLSLKVKISLGV